MNCFSENVTGYDRNGNIKGLQRYGQTSASSYGLIDNLTFTLAGNQLNRVDDAVTTSSYSGSFEFKDGIQQANEYAYGADGRKLRVVHQLGGVTLTTDYCGHVVYESGVQKLLLTEY